MIDKRFELPKKPKIGDYVYRIKSTGSSSDRLGACAVCGKHASEVFLQVEGRIFKDATNNELSITYHKCRMRFGHRECLLTQRRQGEQRR
jgi:hypothetical protein